MSNLSRGRRVDSCLAKIVKSAFLCVGPSHKPFVAMEAVFVGTVSSSKVVVGSRGDFKMRF